MAQSFFNYVKDNHKDISRMFDDDPSATRYHAARKHVINDHVPDIHVITTHLDTETNIPVPTGPEPTFLKKKFQDKRYRLMNETYVVTVRISTDDHMMICHCIFLRSRSTVLSNSTKPFIRRAASHSKLTWSP